MFGDKLVLPRENLRERLSWGMVHPQPMKVVEHETTWRVLGFFYYYKKWKISDVLFLNLMFISNCWRTAGSDENVNVKEDICIP